MVIMTPTDGVEQSVTVIEITGDEDEEEKSQMGLEIYQTQSDTLTMPGDCSRATATLYTNKLITESHLGSPFGLSVGIAILAVLCLIDLYARKTEMEKAKLIALGRIAIEIVILLIYYITTLTWVSKDNSCADAAGSFHDNCSQMWLGTSTNALSIQAYYQSESSANKTFTGLYTSFLVIDVIMVVLGFLKSQK